MGDIQPSGLTLQTEIEDSKTSVSKLTLQTEVEGSNPSVSKLSLQTEVEGSNPSVAGLTLQTEIGFPDLQIARFTLQVEIIPGPAPIVDPVVEETEYPELILPKFKPVELITRNEAGIADGMRELNRNLDWMFKSLTKAIIERRRLKEED
jgi:hypothetical protein